MDNRLKPTVRVSRGRGLIRLTLPILILAIFLALAGCLAITSKSFPEGKYSVQGAGSLILKEGQYHVYNSASTQFNTRQSENGTYTVEGDQITFHMEDRSVYGDDLCRTITDYSYHWAFDPGAQTLTLTRVYDPCPGNLREMALTWSYVQEDE